MRKLYFYGRAASSQQPGRRVRAAMPGAGRFLDSLALFFHVLYKSVQLVCLLYEVGHGLGCVLHGLCRFS